MPKYKNDVRPIKFWWKHTRTKEIKKSSQPPGDSWIPIGNEVSMSFLKEKSSWAKDNDLLAMALLILTVFLIGVVCFLIFQTGTCVDTIKQECRIEQLDDRACLNRLCLKCNSHCNSFY